MKLYTYWRSSAAFRVRIALGLKGLDVEAVPIHLLRDGGEQHQPAYRALNPQGVVPTLLTDAGALTQSLAIIEYLDETRPTPPLLPADALGRARVRALAQAIACDIHPLNNLRVLQYLRRQLGADETAISDWYRHWIAEGLGAVEAMLAGHPATGAYCHGDTPGLADCCLVPQIHNARRYQCALDAYPAINAIVARCEALPAFQRAAPAQQADAE